MTNKIEINELFDFWRKVQRSILHMASLLNPEDLNYSFDPKLNPIGESFYHIARTYHGWLTYTIQDGEKDPERIPTKDLTVENINNALKNAFNRGNRLLEKSSFNDWNKQLTDLNDDGTPYNVSFGWVLWHLIEHDIHHRSQLKLQFKFLNKNIDERIFWEEEDT